MSYAVADPALASTGATLITTGMLPSLMLVSGALTAPVSLVLLWLYRRAVLRSMSAEAGTAAAPADEGSSAATGRPALQTRLIDAGTVDAVDPPLYRDAASRARFGHYRLRGCRLAYALVLTSTWLWFTSKDGFVLTRFLWLLSCYAWPTALAVGMLAAVSRGQRMLVALAYITMLFAVAILGVVRNAELTFGQLVTFWAVTNAPASLLLLAFLHRRVRAVGPLGLSFMVTAVIGSQVLLSAVAADEVALRGAVRVGAVLGLGGTEVFFTLMLLGFALFGIAGWWLLKRIGRRYQGAQDERPIADARRHVAIVRRSAVHYARLRRLGVDLYGSRRFYRL